MKNMKTSGIFALLATLLVISLLMSSSLVFAEGGSDIVDKSSLNITGQGADVSTRCEISKQVINSDTTDKFDIDLYPYPSGAKISTISLANGESITFEGNTSLNAGQYYLEETNPGAASVAYSYEPEEYFELNACVSQIWADYENTADESNGDMLLDPPSATYEVWYIATGNPMNGTKVFGPEVVAPVPAGGSGTIYYQPTEPGNYKFKINHHLNRDPKVAWSDTIEVPSVGCSAPVVVTVTNTFEEESEYGKLYIKKIVNGNGPDGPYEVSLCPTGSPALRVADNGSADDNCIYLEIYKNQENSFKNEAYEFWGWYYVSEYGPVNNNHQGYLVYLSDSNWDYDPDSPIAGDGEEGFQVPDENTPVNLDDPYADVYLVIVNYFKGDTPPGEPELIVKKRIGSGTSTQKYYNAELQKWVCPYLDRVSIMEEGPDVGECSWETIRSFQIAVGEPWSMTLADIYDEYDYGQYRVIETDTGTISNWTSLSYTVDGQSGNEFEIYGEETADIILEVTNNFRTGGGGGGDTWPRLTVEKQIGEGTSTQNTYTVELQKLDDNEWSTKDTFAISPGSSKSVSMQAYGSGTYRIVEINTDQIKNFKSVSYSVSGDPADNSNEFKVSLNGRSSTVTVTNNFKDGDEDITTTEPEPAVPFIPAPEVPEIISIPEPAPALPKTGAAPMAAGLGLILAAGGLAIRRIRK